MPHPIGNLLWSQTQLVPPDDASDGHARAGNPRAAFPNVLGSVDHFPNVDN
jgi:hypothetical protein